MAHRLNSSDTNFAADFKTLINAKREDSPDITAAVADIIADVATRGDAAVLDLTAGFDGHHAQSIADLHLGEDAMAAAYGRIDTNLKAALNLAASRIRDFHQRQYPTDIKYKDAAGVGLGMRHRPIDAAGLYVPGGKAAYPSSVLMNGIPAQVAGVKRRVMAVPPTDGGAPDMVLAAAHIAGITELWTIGGAQAIAAFAYGTQTIAAVDTIVGPGNAYVAAAKRQVFGKVGIDSIAGPSEILILADSDNDPHWIAMDLLSQAEHDEAAQSILITDDKRFADAVSDCLEAILPTLSRSAIAAASWRNHGAIITTRDWPEAATLADKIAPEHLQIATKNPHDLAERITHAGAIFLGRLTPEAIGDYIAGPNHVLPTARTARFSSGLGVLDFMKRTTLVECDAPSLAAIGSAAVTLAKAEGLEAHGLSISNRLSPHDR